MDNIKIQNIYIMYAYAFKVLQTTKFKKLETEEFSNIEEMYASILVIGVSNQVKQGLGKDYVSQKDLLNSPRGKIEISASVKGLTMLNQHLICEFDELTENTYLNQILKSTIRHLVRSKDVKIKATRNSLKKLLLFFRNVDDISLEEVKWSNARFDRNNATYKMLISICYLVREGLIQNENESGNGRKLLRFCDANNMHSLYERFILGYYQRHFPMLKASSPIIKWEIFGETDDFLPGMKTDIVLSYGVKMLIIDAKFYKNAMQKNFDKSTHHSKNLYQIFTYVKNSDTESIGNVSGVLLYAKTNEEVSPNSSYQMGVNKIEVRTLDLNCDFSDISNQLDQLARDHFGDIYKM